jgi:hypothetical protein
MQRECGGPGALLNRPELGLSFARFNPVGGSSLRAVAVRKEEGSCLRAL